MEGEKWMRPFQTVGKSPLSPVQQGAFADSLTFTCIGEGLFDAYFALLAQLIHMELVSFIIYNANYSFTS